MSLISFLKKFDWKIFLPPIILTSAGLVSLFGIGFYRGDFLLFKKQIIFFAVALLLSLVLSFFDLRFLKNNSYLVFSLYAFSLLLLGGLFLFGERIRGVKGWYKIGGISLDPVPISSLILILALSQYFASRHVEISRFRTILFSSFYAIPPFLLVFLQPNLGSSIVFGAIWLGIVIFSGIKLKHFLVLILIFALLFSTAWAFLLKDYQKQRVITFLNPASDKAGNSWNINQSKIAIGSGGIFGKGISKGSQTQYGFLPEPHTDFIFAGIGEEAGLLGLSFLIFVFGFFLWRLVKIALGAETNFLRLSAAGFAFLLLSQGFINMGMNLGLVPIIGLPLPFVSYGGSQILGFYLGLGILNSLNRR